MTKAIKFNLLLDKHPVRDLDDLRANFNLDDLLTAYHSHTLHRWLEVRGLTAELEQLNAIESTDELSIASALCELFQEAISESDIKTAVYPLEFRKQQQQQLEQLASQQFNKEAVIKSYHGGYEQLCADMLKKAHDYPFLKAAVNTLWADYAQLFSVDFNRFFDEFIEKSPLTLFTMLAYYKSSDFEKLKAIFRYTPIGYVIFSFLMKNDYQKSEPFDIKRREILFSRIPTFLFPPYYSYAGKTDGYWKDLQPKGTYCLILKMENGNFIRNANKNGEELNANAINKEFLILDGIDYKSNNADHALIYMVI